LYIAAALPEISSQECTGFDGDDNLYGLGIRLGIYIQWMTTGLALIFVPEEACSMRDVNDSEFSAAHTPRIISLSPTTLLGFRLAMFIALVWATISRPRATIYRPHRPLGRVGNIVACACIFLRANSPESLVIERL
jgi:hypothetical protein